MSVYGPNGSLTPAEVRTAKVIATGRTKRETAALLGLSVHTVNSQVRSAFTKLRIGNREALAAWVIEQVRLGKPGFETL